MAEFSYEKFVKNVAEKALDEILYQGKSIREWMQIIASEDCISRQAVLDKKELVELEDGQSFYCISPEDIEALQPINAQEPLTEEDYIELRDRFGEYVVFVVRDMVSGKGERWKQKNDNNPQYCDRSICVSNEYNGIGCNECEITKSQEPQESEDMNEHYIPIQSLCGDINDIIDES